MINFNEKDEHIQKGVGVLINEIGKVKEDFAKKFILKNIHMPATIFYYATRDMRELRALRKIKKLNSGLSTNAFEKMMFWKNI